VTLSSAETVQERPLLLRKSKARLSDCGSSTRCALTLQYTEPTQPPERSIPYCISCLQQPQVKGQVIGDVLEPGGTRSPACLLARTLVWAQRVFVWRLSAICTSRVPNQCCDLMVEECGGYVADNIISDIIMPLNTEDPGRQHCSSASALFTSSVTLYSQNLVSVTKHDLHR